jgi:hypothetical protein
MLNATVYAKTIKSKTIKKMKKKTSEFKINGKTGS